MSMLSRFATLGGGGDPYWNNVSYLLVGNGANGTTTNIVDSSSNHYATTVNGSVVISTAQNKYGSGSVFYPGTSGSYLNYISAGTFPAPVSFLSTTGTNGTIECWIYPTSVNSDNSLPYFATPILAVGNTYFSMAISNAYKLRYYWFSESPQSIDSTGTISLNTWTYVAIVKSGSTVTFYINGVASGSGTVSNIAWSAAFAGENLYLGYTAPAPKPLYFNGYMYDLRITNGITRTITASPSGPFPTS